MLARLNESSTNVPLSIENDTRLLYRSCTDENHERTSNDRILLTKKKKKNIRGDGRKKRKAKDREIEHRVVVQSFFLFSFIVLIPLSLLFALITFR